MTGNGHGADPIDAAIAAVEATPEPVELRQFQVTISSTGRPAAVLLPVDATDAEIAEFCGWILTAVMNAHRQERAQKPAARILVPVPGQLVRS
jgi:antitoxin (DNA-binding transcriptional repressor) of toxin-antitoxin stability system